MLENGILVKTACGKYPHSVMGIITPRSFKINEHNLVVNAAKYGNFRASYCRIQGL